MDRLAMVYRLDATGAYGAPAAYGPEDSIPVGIFEDLWVDLRELFR